MSELGKQTKKCGWCGEEIKDDEYFTVWKKDKLVMIFCKKCYFERACMRASKRMERSDKRNSQAM